MSCNNYQKEINIEISNTYPVKVLILLLANPLFSNQLYKTKQQTWYHQVTWGHFTIAWKDKHGNFLPKHLPCKSTHSSADVTKPEEQTRHMSLTLLFQNFSHNFAYIYTKLHKHYQFSNKLFHFSGKSLLSKKFVGKTAQIIKTQPMFHKKRKKTKQLQHIEVCYALWSNMEKSKIC